MIKVSGLGKSFKGNEILKNVSFQMREGEILSIIGPSGAGKTTTLRCLSGLERCDKGRIEIDGDVLCREENNLAVYPAQRDVRRIRSKIGMVFQNFNLFPHMSVLQNIIEAPTSVLSLTKEQAEKNAMELLKALDLEDKAQAYPCQLSGGQMQRVAIARACALNPKILCFDEPTSALDPGLRESIAEMIIKLAKEKMSIIIITHDMSFAKIVSNRIILLEKGRIIKEGNTKNFFESA